MSKLADQRYLLNEQYADANNLNARIDLHRLFSVNQQGWHRWLFEQLRIPPIARVLEVGCGPASLWRVNHERIPPGWDITLSDFSAGMLAEAQQNLQSIDRNFTFEVVDAQAIPFADGSFDTVIANHMLYHVPDRPRALAEIRRVLRPGGRFYASTVGQNHMRELKQLVADFMPDGYLTGTQGAGFFGLAEAFTLEDGQDQLVPFFDDIGLHLYDDALIVTEAEPLVAYVMSGFTRAALQDRAAEFLLAIKERIQREGSIRITKSSGIFEAT